MKKAKTASFIEAAKAYKEQKEAAKVAQKEKAKEWKEQNMESKKAKPGMFDPNKYALWI